MRFVDTNILLYSISTDPAEEERAGRAKELMAERDLGLSTQVLQEFYVQATRPTRPDPLTPEQARRLVTSFTRFPVQDITLPIVEAAMVTQERHQISYWDAAIIEAARQGGAELVLSEDLNAGQDYAGVVIENPFA